MALESRSVPRLAYFIWGLAALYYIVQYMVRLVPSVIQSDLMAMFEITAKTSGLLGGLFYYPYILMQMPIGVLADRVGARILLSFGAIFCGLSAYLFATADSLTTLYISRFLLGLFAAAGFVSALKLATVWFPASMFGLIVGLTQAFGMLGASSGGALSYINQEYGFPPIFFVLGTVFIVLAILYYSFVKNAPKETQLQKTNAPIPQGSIAKVFNNRFTWINAFYAGLVYAPVQVLGEYWGGVFLSNVYPISTTQAAWAKSLIFLGWFVGGPLAGMISDRIGRKPVMILSSVCTTLILIIMFLGLNLSFVAILILCFLLGLTNTGLIAAYAASGELHDSHAAGLSMAIANMFSILLGALFIPICGVLLDVFTSGAIDAQGIPIYEKIECLKSFSLLPLSGVLAILCAFLMKETFPRK